MPHRQSASFLQLNNNNNNAQNSTNYTLQFLSLPLPLIEELVINLLNEYIAAAARREGLVGVEGEGKHLKTRFHAKALPATGSGTLGEYLHRLIKFTPFSRSVILLSLLYLDRLVRLSPSSPPLFPSLPSSSRTPSSPSSISSTAPPPPLNALTAHRLLLISLSLASKYSTDANFPQERIAKIGGIGKRELTRLEFEAFRLLGWRLTEGRGEVEGIAREILGEANALRSHVLQLRLEGDLRSEEERIDQEGGGSEVFERRIPLIPIPLIVKSSPSSVSLISQQETEDSHHSSSSEIDDDESFLEREIGGDRATSIAIRQLGGTEEEDEGRSLARSPTEGISIEHRRREYLNLSTQPPPPAQSRQSSSLTSLFRTKPPPTGPSKTTKSAKDIKTQKVTDKGDVAEVGEGRSLARSPTTGIPLDRRRKEYNALALSSQALSKTIRLPAVESDTQESGRSLTRSPTAGISLEGRRREYSTLASKVDSASTNGHLFLSDFPSPSPEGLQHDKKADADAEEGGEGGGRSLAKSPTSGITLENRRKEYFALEVQARAHPLGESGSLPVNFSKAKVLVPLRSPSNSIGSQNQHLMLPPPLSTKVQSNPLDSVSITTSDLPSIVGGRAFTRAPSSKISSKDRQIEEELLSAARKEASVLTANDDSSSISVSGGGRQFARAPSSKISSKDRQFEEELLSVARREVSKSKPETKSLPKVGTEVGDEERGGGGAGGRAFGRAPSSKISGRERRVEETLLAAARVKAGAGK